METIDKKIDIVNAAIEINNDRIAGYEKAMELCGESEEQDLTLLFQKYKEQSENFRDELLPYVQQFGAEPEEGTMVSGKLFRLWMDIKSLVAPYTAKAVLENCEKGEDEFRDAYKKILNDALEDYPGIVDLLQAQVADQHIAHQHIKELRDRT